LSKLKDFGLQLEPQQGMTMQELLDWSRYAEKKGYGYVFRSDHYIPTTKTKRVESPECWSSLGAIAASTKSIKFGPMVTPVGYRSIGILAKMSNTLNSYTGGRLMLGVGAGWYQEEYRIYGYEFPDKAIRRRQLEEALGVLKPLTNGKDVKHKGEFYTVEAEAPRNLKTHILVGGRHSSAAKLAGRFADELNIYGPTADEVPRFRKLLDDNSRGKHVVISLTVPVVIGEDKRGFLSAMRYYLKLANRAGDDPEAAIVEKRKDGLICGTAEEVESQIRERKDAGIEQFYLQVVDLRTPDMADLLTDTLKRV
jgi:alkanesulfonate monooxygenase SsuD/methylene tetrahydromethanopterin reductase-like flavin-dependent oxidoreductase (luciferase family)